MVESFPQLPMTMPNTGGAAAGQARRDANAVNSTAALAATPQCSGFGVPVTGWMTQLRIDLGQIVSPAVRAG